MSREIDQEKNCWTCSHWLIGGGCWKDAFIDGAYSQLGVVMTEHDHYCDDWVIEGTEGTIMYEVGLATEKMEDAECPKHYK
ncbi:hypothetical protein [Brevibacillus laterosporus]|uniref:hypothetical protein n=1 Tax=Brevibacillus laterosporus TaxID=1465 RepID=UPI0018F8A366|nr:hypothetical protein [Brevibacillus laterosporus]MBG9772403.1 hypothetical protein [Brevibacillus laterosporus]